MDEIVLDIEHMKADLTTVTDEAFVLADRLADLAVTRVVGTSVIAEVAREYQEKRVHVRRLRRAIKAEVAG